MTHDDDEAEAPQTFNQEMHDIYVELSEEFECYHQEMVKEFKESTPDGSEPTRSETLEDWTFQTFTSVIYQNRLIRRRLKELEEKLKSLGLG